MKSERKVWSSFIQSRQYRTEWSIEPLSDRYGSATRADFDALVVSEETLPIAHENKRGPKEKWL